MDEAVERLEAAFGTLHDYHRPPLPSVFRAATKGSSIERVQERVRACALCDLRAGCSEPVPISDNSRVSHTGQSVLILGEGPGRNEDQAGEPFVGKAGLLLRKLGRQAGMDMDKVQFMNTVACRPPKNRAPTLREMQACRGNVRDQIAAANVGVVVLAGSVATSAWREGMELGKVRGKWFVWSEFGVWVIPTYHPAAALRQFGYKALIQSDLELVSFVMKGELEPRLEDMCLCRLGQEGEDGRGLYRWDEDGVPWCRVCWEKRGKKAWQKNRERWTVPVGMVPKSGVTQGMMNL